ncbi:aspartyl/asparaginyl beta-hydroxylase domain-containing protein [Serratia ureilytica]
MRGFNTFFKRGWKRFYLKWYSDSHPSAQALCPKPSSCSTASPSVKAAMFAELPPGAIWVNTAILTPARCARYHLGLMTPNDDRCFIEVDGEQHSWRDGEAVIFDETYRALGAERHRSNAHHSVLRRRAADEMALGAGGQPLGRRHAR